MQFLSKYLALVQKYIFFIVEFLIGIGNVTIASLSTAILLLFFITYNSVLIVRSVNSRLTAFFHVCGHILISLIVRAWKSIRSIRIRSRVRVKQRAKKKEKSKIVPPSLARNMLLKVRYTLLGIVIAVLFFSLFQTYELVKNLPNPSMIGEVNFPVSTQILDRNGVLLYEIYKDQNRTPVPLESIPEYLVQATISIEDKDFYNHNGVSLVGGIARALKDSARTGSLQGGSTITQQLIKTSLLSPERTLLRKIREAILAMWAERIYSKQEILEMYLNQVSYGGSAYGVEEAAQTYLGKSVKDISVGEAAFLSGMPKAPSTYSPHANYDLAVRRRNEVLQKMYEQFYISESVLSEELAKPLVIKKLDAPIKSPHFVFFVKDILEKQYGSRMVEEGGLRVYTSIDSRLQTQVESIVTEQLDSLKRYNVGNAGALITIPSTGEILAMVGSKDYFEEPYGAYNVTTAVRQPGSTIKPLLYSLALEKGYTLATILQDTPVVYKTSGSKPYAPVNYDGTFHGAVPLRYALGNSYNVPAVKTLNDIGVKQFIEHAQKMGISTWKNPDAYGLSITLGGGGSTLYDLSTAYGVFANGGERVDLAPISLVEDYKGNILYRSDNIKGKKVVDEKIAFLINSTLSDDAARRNSFGSNSLLVIPQHTVAVKTGTSNDKRDNLTIGYSNTFLAAVWVGNNDNAPMNPALTSGITGAAPIWHSIMNYMLNSYAQSIKVDTAKPSFEPPKGIIKKRCTYGREEYFIEGSDKSVSCIFQTPSIAPLQEIVPR